MEITEIQSGTVTAVAVKGRIDGATAGPLRDRLSKLIASGLSRLVVDFREVAYISSAGFRTLLIIAKQSEDSAGHLALCGISSEVRRLFEIAAFTDLFLILPSREEAIAELAKSGGS
ncbi:MAG TPA: STAS domain-containing protein [Burkholderiales bacterium]|jgi:anti-anti-sigma factor|nr:STAS domain-containing protein [Burkholderiales bacterium]